MTAMIGVFNLEELTLWLLWVDMSLESLFLSRRDLRVGDFTDKRIELESRHKPMIGHCLCSG